jgi:hypothetical protein
MLDLTVFKYDRCHYRRQQRLTGNHSFSILPPLLPELMPLE